MPNYQSVVHSLLVDFGGGYLLLTSYLVTCDRGKTKSTPTPSNCSSVGFASSEWSLTIEKGLKKLPMKEKDRIEKEEEKKRNLEVAETRKTLCKLRNKEQNLKRKSEKVERLEKIIKMEEKMEFIEK